MKHDDVVKAAVKYDIISLDNNGKYVANPVATDEEWEDYLDRAIPLIDDVLDETAIRIWSRILSGGI